MGEEGWRSLGVVLWGGGGGGSAAHSAVRWSGSILIVRATLALEMRLRARI